MKRNADKRGDIPHILLVNPWIDDFAAYDFWAKPLGLLTIGGILRGEGYVVSYIDCLDRFVSHGRQVRKDGRFGKGPYRKTVIAKPEKLQDVPRRYSRYGISERDFRKSLLNMPEPDAVLVTALMTYWYPGAFAVIRIIREVFAAVPILLGGVYASLCSEHARKYAGADRVVSGQADQAAVEVLADITGFSRSHSYVPGRLDTYPYPCLDLQRVISYVPILTGRGCPYRCAYCASSYLNPDGVRRSPEHVVEEMTYWHERYGVMDFAFYDDALLLGPQDHIMPILEGLIRRDIRLRLHTPNALHIRPLNKEVATLLRRAGFKTVRLGLETAFFEHRETLDHKVGPAEFERAAGNLKQAGFTGDELGAYLLFGLPGQDMGQLEASIRIVKANGIRPILAQYSPIPHTELWDEAVKVSRYDLETDPIFHNNSIFPCQETPFSWDTVSRLKALTQ
jgi:radical SAM superfamily enzyme YgiQ (UPF0313 family)